MKPDINRVGTWIGQVVGRHPFKGVSQWLAGFHLDPGEIIGLAFITPGKGEGKGDQEETGLLSQEAQ